MADVIREFGPVGAVATTLPEVMPGEPEPQPGVLGIHVEVHDPEVIQELLARVEAEREQYARTALRIGVLALRAASGAVDAGAIKSAGERLVGELREVLTVRGAEISRDVGAALSRYLDPSTGALEQRLESLLSKDGRLDQLLRSHLDGDQSLLARTLATRIGETSPIFRMLSPTDAGGLRMTLAATIEEALAEQRDVVLKEFSLDRKESALSRLVAEVKNAQEALRDDVKAKVEGVVEEFSLDSPDSALSRLVKRVEATQELVAKQFSLDREDSALSRMTSRLNATGEKIDRSLTLDDESSALSRLKRELMGTISDLASKNATFQADVRATLERLDARREEAARGTAHGGEFEEQLGALLTDEASRAGDVCEPTGSTVGAIARCKVGDFVVQLGPESAAPGGRVAVEAKEDQSYGLKEALAEIELARKNREAQTGVFVFSRKAAPAGLPPFTRHGRDVVAIWDSEDPTSDVVVRAALSVARALVVKEAAHSAETSEAVARIERAVRALEKHLEKLEEIRKWAATIRSNGEKIERQAGTLSAELEEHVKAIDDQVVSLQTAGTSR